jgi:hypothetical protein
MNVEGEQFEKNKGISGRGAREGNGGMNMFKVHHIHV